MPNSTQEININTEDDHVSTYDNVDSLEGIKIKTSEQPSGEVVNESSMIQGQSDVSKMVSPNEADFMSSNETDFSISEKRNEEEEKEGEYDSDETVDCGNDEISQKFLMTT